jgi:hypothetical protein
MEATSYMLLTANDIRKLLFRVRHVFIETGATTAKGILLTGLLEEQMSHTLLLR